MGMCPVTLQMARESPILWGTTAPAASPEPCAYTNSERDLRSARLKIVMWGTRCLVARRIHLDIRGIEESATAASSPLVVFTRRRHINATHCRTGLRRPCSFRSGQHRVGSLAERPDYSLQATRRLGKCLGRNSRDRNAAAGGRIEATHVRNRKRGDAVGVIRGATCLRKPHVCRGDLGSDSRQGRNGRSDACDYSRWRHKL